MTELLIEAPGAFTTVQDLGRAGFAHLGVARSGAADRASLRLANRLVGNPESTAALEVLLGGLVLRATDAVTLAVTGAPCPVTIDGRAESPNVALRLQPGEGLSVGIATAGLRVYVAIRGGVDVPAVLGSRSYDQLGELGPPPLRAGDRLPVGDAATGLAWHEPVPIAQPSAQTVLRVLAGPRDDWLSDDWLSNHRSGLSGLRQLTDHAWQVGAASNRIGVRLQGPPIARRAGELPSEGMVCGAIQLPADGQPILLGPDAGVTGGYPVIAVVLDADRDAIGQLRPGALVSFRAVG